MGKYYEEFKILILATTFSGLYFPAIENIYGSKWYIKKLKLIALFPLICLPVYFIASVKYLLFDESNLLGKTYGFVVCIYSFFSTFVVYIYYYAQKDFVRVFELWDSLFQEELYPEERQVLLQKNKKIVNLWLKVFGGLSILSATSYSILAYFAPEKKLDHPTGIPYRHQSPDFELIVTLELFIAVFGFATLITYDSITMVLLSLEEAQFQHLKNSLEQIIGVLSLTDSGQVVLDESLHQNLDYCGTAYENSGILEAKDVFPKVEEKIHIWISHHLQVLRFHYELQKIYYLPLSVKFSAFVLIICLVSFLSVSEGGFNITDTIISLLFCCNNYALFYVNIHFADSINDAAQNIFEKAFGQNWHLYPEKLKSTFKIILLRSNLPVQYTAFRIYTLSSRSFLKILSTAYSIFTFLLHISRKKE